MVRRLIRTVFALCLVLAIALAAMDGVVSNARSHRVFTPDAVPPHDVALVLGTSPWVADGRRNLHFEGRMNLAAELYRMGKAKRLLVSGDNRRADYDEPTAMKKALIARGIPESAIVLDYAGFRTLDSVARAKSAFGFSSLIVVSDDFHVARALYLAEAFGLDAVACEADTSSFLRTGIRLREHCARVLAFMDVHVTRKQPHFVR